MESISDFQNTAAFGDFVYRNRYEHRRVDYAAAVYE